FGWDTVPLGTVPLGAVLGPPAADSVGWSVSVACGGPTAGVAPTGCAVSALSSDAMALLVPASVSLLGSLPVSLPVSLSLSATDPLPSEVASFFSGRNQVRMNASTNSGTM